MEDNNKKHTWKFYVTIGLTYFIVSFLLDLLIQGGYSDRMLVHNLIIAVLFPTIWWAVERWNKKKKQ